MMDLKMFATVFVTVFLAELGDKTQIATLLYASNSPTDKLMVFSAAALALLVATALAVFVGSWVGDHINQKLVSTVAGIGFIAIGAWLIYKP